jgi:hypothetical protein
MEGAVRAALADALCAVGGHETWTIERAMVAAELRFRRGSLGRLLGQFEVAPEAELLSEARTQLDEAARLAERVGDWSSRAMRLANLGVLEGGLGDQEASGVHLQEAVTLFQKLGSPHVARAEEALQLIAGAG